MFLSTLFFSFFFPPLRAPRSRITQYRSSGRELQEDIYCSERESSQQKGGTRRINRTAFTRSDTSNRRGLTSQENDTQQENSIGAPQRRANHELSPGFVIFLIQLKASDPKKVANSKQLSKARTKDAQRTRNRRVRLQRSRRKSLEQERAHFTGK